MSRTAARLVAVGGGKGGVGKSVLTGNLAVAMAQAGRRVVLVDADLGAANQHTLFGLVKPQRTLADFFSREIDTLSGALSPTCVPGLWLIPGTSAVPGMANINHGQKQRLIKHIERLEADVVVIDVGAGTSYNVVDLFDVADLRLLVLTPQLPAVQNAYGFAKAAVHRLLAAEAKRAGAADLVPAQAANETDRVADFLARAADRDHGLAGRWRALLDNFGLRIIGNQVFDDQQGRVFHAVSRMVRDFLGVQAPVLGMLRASRRLHDSVSRSLPFLVEKPMDQNAIVLRALADTLLTEDVTPLREARLSRVTPAVEPEGEPGQLPVSLAGYLAQAERWKVDWPATLHGPDGALDARIIDVSGTGALVQTAFELEVGGSYEVVFDTLGGTPTVPILVRNESDIDEGCYGVEFLAENGLPKSVLRHAQEGR